MIVGDYGTPITVVFKDADGSLLNTSAASSLTITVDKGDGTTFTRTAIPSPVPIGTGDGLDGKATIWTTKSDADRAGRWRVEGLYTRAASGSIPEGGWHSTPYEFRVLENLRSSTDSAASTGVDLPPLQDNLVMDIDPHRALADSDGRVLQAVDSKGTFNFDNLGGETKPTLIASGLNGRKTMLFDKSKLQALVCSSGSAITTPEHTVVVIAKAVGPAATPPFTTDDVETIIEFQDDDANHAGLYVGWRHEDAGVGNTGMIRAGMIGADTIGRYIRSEVNDNLGFRISAYRASSFDNHGMLTGNEAENTSDTVAFINKLESSLDRMTIGALRYHTTAAPIGHGDFELARILVYNKRLTNEEWGTVRAWSSPAYGATVAA